MSDEPERARLAKRRKTLRPVINEPSTDASGIAPPAHEEQAVAPQEKPVSEEQQPPSEKTEPDPQVLVEEPQKEAEEETAKAVETQGFTEPTKQEPTLQEPVKEAKAEGSVLDFEKFDAEPPKPELESLTYAQKIHRRSRNPLSRVTGIVSRKKSAGSSKDLIRSKARSKEKPSKSRKSKGVEGTEFAEAPIVTKFFGRVRDVSGILSTPPKVKTLESTIKPPSPFLKVALKLFREYFQARESKYSKLENALRASKMPYSSVQYLSLAVFVSLLMAGVDGVLIGYFAYLLGPFYILAIAGGGMAVLSFIVVFLSLPSSASKKRKKDIESKLPMALGYIATMASADLPVDQILFELGESPEYGAVSKEAKTISLATRVFGKDIVTALRDGAKYSPSPKLSEFLQGIVTTVTSGGNLKQYFKTKAMQYQGELSNLIRSNAESIGILAESYVTVGVAFPLMLIVILGVVASLQSSSSGMLVVLYLIDLLIIPLITIMFAFLISSTIKEIKI